MEGFTPNIDPKVDLNMFIRNPSNDFFESVILLGAPKEYANGLYKMRQHNLAEDNKNQSLKRKNYLESAYRSYSYLVSQLDNLKDISTLKEVLTQFGKISTYKIDDSGLEIKGRILHREIIPNEIMSIAQHMLEYLKTSNFKITKASYKFRIELLDKKYFRITLDNRKSEWLSITYYGAASQKTHENILKTLLYYTQECLSENLNKDEKLEAAIHAYYIILNAWFWYPSNMSRSTNYFNALLEKINIKPLPHGIADFIAYTCPYNIFRTYILEVLKRREKF